jgi:general transcription factor 3C polypeptide 5 (transcription factor C subunit 1)
MEDSNYAEESASTEPRPCAPAHELPSTHFYSVEYPSYVRPESVCKAVDCLGGQSSIDRAFRRNAPKEDSLLELNLRPDNPFSHPLPGDLVPTNNILLKVVKRKPKRPPNDDDHDKGGGGSGSPQTVIGEYTAVAVGVIPKTARFRSEQPSPCRPREPRRALRTVIIEVWPIFSTNPPKTIPFPSFAGQ